MRRGTRTKKSALIPAQARAEGPALLKFLTGDSCAHLSHAALYPHALCLHRLDLLTDSLVLPSFVFRSAPVMTGFSRRG